MKKIISFLLISLLVIKPSFALEQDYAFQRMMNKTISGVVANKYSTTQTSAKVNSTIRSMSSTLAANASKVAAGAAVVGGVAIGAVAAPSFLAAVATMTAAGILVTGTFKLADKYIFGPGGEFSSSSNSSTSNTTAGADYYWYTLIDGGLVFTNTAEQAAWQYVQNQINIGGCLASGYDFSKSVFNYSGTQIVNGKTVSPTSLNFNLYAFNSSGSYAGSCAGSVSITAEPITTSCPNNQVYYYSNSTHNYSCIVTTNPGGSSSGVSKTQLKDIYDVLTESEKNAQLTNKQLADLINVIRKESASVDTIPYEMADPVTEADVQAYKDKAGITANPTVGDLLKPNPNATSTDPMTNDLSLPQQNTNSDSPGTSSTVNNKNVTEVKLDLGPDPGIGEPNLEKPPTGQEILQPLLDILNPFKNLNVSFNSQCPTYQLDVLDHHYELNSHCTLLSQNDGLIRTIMTSVFIIAGVLILLGA